MMRSFAFPLTLALALGSFYACGGSAGTDLVAGGDSGTGDAASTDGANVGEGLTTGAPDGSTDGAADTGITGSDGGPGGNTASLNCGSTACAIPGNVCCVTDTGGGTFAFQCTSGTTCPVADGGGGGGGTGIVNSLQCSATANCAAGLVCCMTSAASVVSSTCEVSCGTQAAQLCDPAASSTGCPADAGKPSMCLSNNIGDWGLPPTYATCGGKGN